MFEIKVNSEEVRGELSRLSARLSNLSPLMRRIAGDMHDAIMENFEQQGRPDRWKPSRRAEEQGGKTLQNTGRLIRSIRQRSTATEAIVGTNVAYAIIHQFGAKTEPRIIVPRRKKALFWPGARHPVKSVRHPGSTIPARPFLVLTDADIAEILRRITTFLCPMDGRR